MYIYQTTTAYSSFNLDTSSSKYQSGSTTDSLNNLSRSNEALTVLYSLSGVSNRIITSSEVYMRTAGTSVQASSNSYYSEDGTTQVGQNRTASNYSTSQYGTTDFRGNTASGGYSDSASSYISGGTISSYRNVNIHGSTYSNSETFTYSAQIPSSTTQTSIRRITTSRTSEYNYIRSTLLSGSIISTTTSTSQYSILTYTFTNDFTVTRGTTVSTSSYTPYVLANVYKTQSNWSLGYNIGYFDTVPAQTLFRKSDMLLQTAEATIPEKIIKSKTVITPPQANITPYSGTSVGGDISLGVFTTFGTISTTATRYYWSSSGVSSSTQEQYLLEPSTFQDYSNITQISTANFTGPTATREAIVGVVTITTQFNLTGSLNTPHTISGVYTNDLTTESSVYELPWVLSYSNIITSPNATVTQVQSQTVVYEEEVDDTATFINYELVFDGIYGSQDKFFIKKQHGDALHLGYEAYLPATTSVSENLGYFEITNPLSFSPSYNYLSYGPSYGNYNGILKFFRSSGNVFYTYGFNIGTFRPIDPFSYGDGRVVPEIAQSSYSLEFNDDTNASTLKSVTVSHSVGDTYFYTLVTNPTTRTESTFKFSYGNQAGTMYKDTSNFLFLGDLGLFQLTSIGGGKQMLYGTDYGSFVDIPSTRNLQSFIYGIYGVSSNSARKSFLYTKITDSSGGTTSGTTEYSTFSSSAASFLEAYANVIDGWQLVSNIGNKFPSLVPYPLIYPQLAYYSQPYTPIYPRQDSFSFNVSSYYSSAFTTFR